jgi:hypothetical protein
LLWHFSLFALAANENSKTVKSSYIVSDSLKKMPSAAKLRKAKKDLNKVLPKGVSNAIVNTMKGAASGDFFYSPKDMIKMNYEIEKEEITNDFKSESFDSASDKREARREMKEDLKKLKKGYKKELKENREDETEMKAAFK